MEGSASTFLTHYSADFPPLAARNGLARFDCVLPFMFIGVVTLVKAFAHTHILLEECENCLGCQVRVDERVNPCLLQDLQFSDFHLLLGKIGVRNSTSG